MNLLTNNEIDILNGINTNTIKMKFGERVNKIIDKMGEYAAGSPVNAVNAKIALTLSGVAKHGETVTVNNPSLSGIDVYEFLSDEAQKKTVETNKAVDITSYADKAVGTLTIDTQPVSGDKMTIGGKVYTFVPVGTDTADGEISVGTDLETAQANILAAINGTDENNTAHTLVFVFEFVENASIITALVGGTAGNAIETTETFTAVTNIFAADALATGTDCSAANAITALVAAINALDTQGVAVADGTGDKVDFTADVAGIAGNDIEVGKTLVNGAFADNATKLSGGVNGTVGEKGKPMIDTSYIYYCVADNTIADKNWRRISLGDVY